MSMRTRRWLRWVVPGTGVLAVGIGTGVLWLSRGPREVSEVPLPPDSALTGYLAGAAYMDNFRMQAPRSRFPDVRSLDAISFQRGELVAQNEQEIVYRGSGPGIIYYVRYATIPADSETTSVEMSTVVHMMSRKGGAYFAFVRPIHHIGAPWAFRHYVRRAIADVQ